MDSEILVQKLFSGGISPSKKVGIEGSFQFSQSINTQTDPSEIVLLPKTVKVSGSTVTDLIKWFVSGHPYDTNTYAYSEGGKIYKGTSGDSWTLLRTVSNSHGQGLEIFDDYLYYVQDTQVGRYGPLSGTPAFTDNWATGYNDTSTNGFAPIKAFLEGFAVGHGNMVAWFDGSVIPTTGGTQVQEDALSRLLFAPGETVRAIDVVDEYLVVSTLVGDSIRENETGYMYFWDGSSEKYNFYIPCENGSVHGLVNSSNRVFSIMGSTPNIYLNYRPFQKIQRIPKINVDDFVEVWPGAMSNWKGNVMVGVSADDDGNNNLVQGVYQWGTQSSNYPEVLNLAYVISTGSTTGIKIGSVKGMGNNLFISWKDGANYGVDKVAFDGDPYSSGYLETMIYDDARPYWDKLILAVKATHLPIRAGESVKVSYRKDRTTYIDSDVNSTVGSRQTLLIVDPQYSRFLEAEFKVTITGTTTSPTVTGLSARYDPLTSESLNYSSPEGL